MRTIARSLAGTVAGILLLGPAAAGADPAGRCTHDTFAVDGAPLAATVCAAGDAASRTVTVNETFARNGRSISRSLTMDALAGTVAREIDNVPLDELGSSKTLHVTIAYAEGNATIEHALLLPGAVVLK